MDKMKILYFMDGVGYVGGIQEMTLKWVGQFNPAEVQVDILSYDTGRDDGFSERFEKYGGKVYLIPTFTRKGCFKESIRATKEFFRDHHDYDILHAHASSKAYFVLKYARKNGIRVRILHSHCTSFVNRTWKSLLVGNIMKPFANRLTTDYFACSTEAGEFLFGKKRMRRSGVMVPNGIELDAYQYDPATEQSIREELHLGDKLVIGHVGRFVPQKNHEFLIDVFAEIHQRNENSVLVLAGVGQLMEHIKEKVSALGLTDCVRFLGYRTDIHCVMQAFDVFLMTSLFEGLPVTGVEAQAIGVPCVFSKSITRDAAIIPCVTYVDVREKPEIWADTVLTFAHQGKFRESIQYLLDRNYSIERSAALLLKLYRELVCRAEHKKSTKNADDSVFGK